MSVVHEPQAPPAPLMLRLYVAGESPNSLRAIANLVVDKAENRARVSFKDQTKRFLVAPARARH